MRKDIFNIEELKNKSMIDNEIKEVKQKILSLDSNFIVGVERSLFSHWDSLLKTDELYYYTDVNTFINGIVTREQNKDKELCLWATRWSHLNDPTENQIGIKLMEEMQTPSEIVNQLISNIDKNHSISLTKAYDSLPMWKMYGAGGNGIMLAFDCKQLIDIYDYLLQICIYEGDEYDKSFINSMANLEFGEEFHRLDENVQRFLVAKEFMMYCSIVKDKHFDYEKEVRIVGVGNPFFDKNEKEICYRYSDGKVIPYVKEYLPKSLLKRVCLGPLTNTALSKTSLKEFLESKGFSHIEVETSAVPYRR